MQDTFAINITGLNKVYDNGFCALTDVNLEIRAGEIFALLGSNGAGKSTLINTICGVVMPTSGSISVLGYDHIKNYREARTIVGLVPQELTTDTFQSVWNAVNFSRGLFGKPRNHDYVEKILKNLSLWDKKDSQIRHLSGGMKRRVMIAKALSHEPKVLFLDEPSAGVDVELRKSMWEQVRKLREMGVTIILTTHYIEEAEEMADRIGFIEGGKIIMTEDKKTLMNTMGQRQVIFVLRNVLNAIPDSLSKYDLKLEDEGSKLILIYSDKVNNDISNVLEDLKTEGIMPKDIHTRQSSLEEIFIKLTKSI